MQHVLGIHPGEKLPSKLRRASRLTDSTMLDVLIVAFDVESGMSTHEWMADKRGGAILGVSILDTRHIRHELRSETAPGLLGLNKAFRPLQFHVLSDRPQCQTYNRRQKRKFTFGKSVELQAEHVSPTMHKLLTGRDVITVFHHARNDKMMLKSFGVEANKRQLLEVDTYDIAVALGIQSSLEVLSQMLFIDIDLAHVAGNDALATLKVVCHLATLLPDPRFGTHNDHGRLLRSRLFADVADHPWLAGQISSMVGKTHGKQSDVTELALGHLEGFIHAYRSRGQQFSWLEHRHWAARLNFALRQIRQPDNARGLEHRQIQRAGYLQQLPELPELLELQELQELLEPLEPSSADPSRQPLLPTPPPEEAETAHTQTTTTTTTTTTTDSVDKNQAIADTRLTSGQCMNLSSRYKRLAGSIAGAVRLQHEMHTECLSHWVHQLHSNWSRRSGQMKQWAVSIHHVNRRCADKLFQIERKFSVQANLDILADHLKGSAASSACQTCHDLKHKAWSKDEAKEAQATSPSPLSPLRPSGGHQSSAVEEPRCEDPISQELESNWMI
jgi:DNA polymerase III epsilon subunit-like protein